MLRTFFILFMFIFATSAHADLLCAKKSAKVKKNGKYNIAKYLKITSGGCPKGYLAVMNTDNYKGNNGATGSQGPAGILNLGSCRSIIGTSSIIGATDVGSAIADCTSSEFLLTHGGSTDSLDVEILSVNLRGFSGEGFSSGVEYAFGRNDPSDTYTVAVGTSAICCAR